MTQLPLVHRKQITYIPIWNNLDIFDPGIATKKIFQHFQLNTRMSEISTNEEWKNTDCQHIDPAFVRGYLPHSVPPDRSDLAENLQKVFAP